MKTNNLFCFLQRNVSAHPANAFNKNSEPKAKSAIHIIALCVLCFPKRIVAFCENFGSVDITLHKKLVQFQTAHLA